MQNLLVQKYGGSSVSTVEKIANVAKNIERSLLQHPKIVVVVSAMGSYTDELLDLAYQLNPKPPKRELDMLVTTGERISTALLSIALASRGIPARSLTGSQSGILTDEIHGNARIRNIKPSRVLEYLQDQSVVIIAGFQGVSPTTKDITSLGRGGSDLSAIALCAALEGSLCEIYTDVRGVMSADPRIVANAQTIARIPWPVMSELAWAGAGVLHHRGAYLASKYKIPVKILSTHDDLTKMTLISGEVTMESPRVFSITTRKNLSLLRVRCANNPQLFASQCLKWLWEREVSPAVFEWHSVDEETFSLIALFENHLLDDFLQNFSEQLDIVSQECVDDLALINVVGQGFRQSPELAEAVLKDLGVQLHYFNYQDQLISLAVDPPNYSECLQTLHARFFSSETSR